ncbi:hypothetical protein ACLOAV_004504 [Pseudogymnoascus australis]
MHDEQALEHLLENLPDEKVFKSPFVVVLQLSGAQVLSYIFLHLHRRQAAIPPFLDRQPSARSQLVALGKLAVVDFPSSPAATPISIDQTPQAPLPSISERHLEDEHEENGGMGICQEMATPSDSLSTHGYEHDSQRTDVPHTRVSSQEGASPDSSVPGTPNSTGINEGSLANPSLVQEGGLEHDIHPHVPVLEETAIPAEAGDGAVQHSTNTSLDVAQAVYAEEPLQTREDVSSPLNSNADSHPTAKSHSPHGQKRKPDPSTSGSKRPKENKLMDDSVTVHDIIFVLERFALHRDSIATRGDHADHIDQDELQQHDPDRRPGLKMWDAFNERKEKGNLLHPSELYVDVCSSETTITDGELPSKQAIGARAQAKRQFQNEVQKKKLWVMMLKRYGIAVFLLLHETLQEDQ